MDIQSIADLNNEESPDANLHMKKGHIAFTIRSHSREFEEQSPRRDSNKKAESQLWDNSYFQMSNMDIIESKKNYMSPSKSKVSLPQSKKSYACYINGTKYKSQYAM